MSALPKIVGVDGDFVAKALNDALQDGRAIILLSYAGKKIQLSKLKNTFETLAQLGLHFEAKRYETEGDEGIIEIIYTDHPSQSMAREDRQSPAPPHLPSNDLDALSTNGWTRIDDLQLPNRTKNALLNRGVQYTFELATVSEDRWHSVSGVGRSGKRSIGAALTARGLRANMRLPEDMRTWFDTNSILKTR